MCRHAFVAALTHAIDEVRWYAARGIGKYLWGIDRALTLRCVTALAMEASWVQIEIDEERRRLLAEKMFSELHNSEWVQAVEAGVAASVRQLFFEDEGIPANALETFDPTKWSETEANSRILAILGEVPTEPAAVECFRRLGQRLVAWWNTDDERRRGGHRSHQERNHRTESAQMMLLENFVLRTAGPDAANILKPIVDAVDRHPDKVHWFLVGLIGVEDLQPNTAQFWMLWKLFADKVRRSNWLARIDDEHASGREMLSAIFLGTWWKKEVRHWRSLEGHAENINMLFDDLPTSSRVLNGYVRFLHHVGEQSLPQAFIRIMNRLQQGDHRQMLRNGNTVFLLELLLQRYVYGRPLELKRQNDLRNAILGLLDLLIENGSSAAFRMRDDFVTPLSMT